jgi:uncharacterized protein YegL
MKKGLTELVFILDRSGSMGGLESDTIGGYNSMMEKQKKEPGEAIITTVLFDDQYELLHDRIKLSAISTITEKEYFVRGSTALLDAIGKSIHKIVNVQRHTAEEERAERVLFVITTDGMENASREYAYEDIRKMIEHEKEKYGWEFLFLGANIDAVSTAARFGIDSNRAVRFHADKKGTAVNYDVVCKTVASFRASNSINDNWKKLIDDDYQNRDGVKKGKKRP